MESKSEPCFFCASLHCAALYTAQEKKEREVGRIRAVLEVQENDLEGAKKKLAASLEENKALKEARDRCDCRFLESLHEIYQYDIISYIS